MFRVQRLEKIVSELQETTAYLADANTALMGVLNQCQDINKLLGTEGCSGKVLPHTAFISLQVLRNHMDDLITKQSEQVKSLDDYRATERVVEATRRMTKERNDV